MRKKIETLFMNVADVCAVLLSDGWHPVRKASFDIAPLEFTKTVYRRPGESRLEFIYGCTDLEECLPEDPGPAYIVASWQEEDRSAVYCPIGSVLAVREAAISEEDQERIDKAEHEYKQKPAK